MVMGAVSIMKAAKISGDFLPWRDILHEGPVPADLNLQELSLVRAEYLSSHGYGSLEEITQNFKARDAQLASFEQYDKIILWFEHDLYDQLQILQLLSFFNKATMGTTKLTMICRDQYLGRQSPEQLKEMQRFETEITKEQLTLGQKAWTAFRNKSPQAWEDLFKRDTSSLPFLKGAIERTIEEYPHKDTGLSRTGHQILTLLFNADLSFNNLFLTYQKTEESEFMGDSGFCHILMSFLQHSPSLIALSYGDQITVPYDKKQIISITPEGREILSPLNSSKFNLPPDTWIGGIKFA